jgi:hypothetical protein
MFKFISCLDNYGVVLLLDFVSFDHWCTDVYLVWRKPNRNAGAFLHNLRNDQFLH